jgi:tetraacyldisaccharide 4'-kinase
MTRILLFPFSFLFGVITYARNKLYDWKCISSVQYDDIYVVSAGNITVGGTGKTPFVEYLARTLSKDYRVAVLSRGYKRTTKGFRFADGNATPAELGDEPYQIKRKFPNVVVAVDADRVRGIAQIRKAYPNTQVILLDDAFQYRKIKPNFSILLADYSRPLYRDSMLPGGRLREWACFAKRADVMVVTKSPAEITPDEQRNIQQEYARIFPRDIFFSSIGYGEPAAVFPNGKSLSNGELQQYDVLLVTGIANPKPFETHILQHAASVQTVTFPDHHAFSEKDIAQIAEKWDAIPSAKKILLTTEKDAVRLQQMKIPETIAQCSYYVPIEVKFSDHQSSVFTNLFTILRDPSSMRIM